MKKRINDNVAIVVAIVLILVYVIAESYTVNNSKLLTQMAVVSTVNETISTKAIIVRDEHVIANTSNGIVVPCYNDGDKIKNASNVAMVFDSQESASAYSKKQELEKEIQKYTKLQGQSSGIASNIDSLNKEIANNVDNYIRQLSSNSFDKIKSSSDSLNESLIRRQLLIGENVDFSAVLNDLNNEYNGLNSVAPSSYIPTDMSGVFTSYTDGYENLIDYNNVNNLTVDEVNSYIQTVLENKQETNNIGKLVTGYNWYMLCVVDTNDVKNMNNGAKIKIALSNRENSVIEMKIISGAEPNSNQSQTVLVLKSNDDFSNILNQRCEDIEIIREKYTGVKVPVEAIHIENDKKGVYALIATQVKFREAEVIYTTDDYVLLSYDDKNKDGIHLYDQIIIQGKELSDGRIYT